MERFGSLCCKQAASYQLGGHSIMDKYDSEVKR